MEKIDTDKERKIAGEAFQRGVNSVLINLFEESDKKGVLRSLWGKTMSLTGANNTTKYSDAELKAYASAALQCYQIMKSDYPALDTHAKEAFRWDMTPTNLVHIPLTIEDIKMYGSRSGH